MSNQYKIECILESLVEKFLQRSGDDKTIVLNKLEELNQLSNYSEINKRELTVLETKVGVTTAKELVDLTPHDLFKRFGNHATFNGYVRDILLEVFSILVIHGPAMNNKPFREHNLETSIGQPFFPCNDATPRTLKIIIKTFLGFGKNPWVEIPEILANINTEQLMPPLPVYKDPDELHPALKDIVTVPSHFDYLNSDKFYLPRLHHGDISVDEHNNLSFGQLRLHRDTTGIYAIRLELEEMLLSGQIDHTPLNIDFLPTLKEGYINLLVKWGLNYDGIKLLKDIEDGDELTSPLSPTIEKIYDTITLLQSAGAAKLLQHTNDPRGEINGKNFFRLPTLPGVTFIAQDHPTDMCGFYDEVNDLSFYISYPE